MSLGVRPGQVWVSAELLAVVLRAAPRARWWLLVIDRDGATHVGVSANSTFSYWLLLE